MIQLLLSKKRLNQNTPVKEHLVTYANPYSVIADQFRTIRSNIRFLMQEDQSQLFLLTSPKEGEGKSTVIANLGISMAQLQEKVLLIDANLRAPVIHHLFKVPNELGLSSVLKRQANVENVIHRTTIGNLDVLPGGQLVKNPAELVGKEIMENTLKTLTMNYDIVLIDSPPLLTSTETRMLANYCEGVIMILQRGRTKSTDLEESKKVLDLAHAHVLGAIINEK